MNFCTECGHELKDGQSFCTECGAKYQTAAAPTVNKNTQQRAGNKQAPKKPLSKKTKIVLGSVAGLLIILFTTYQILSSYFNPMKALQEMDTAIAENDAETFLDYIDFDEEVTLDEATYFQYMKEEEWGWVRDQYLNMIESEDELFSYQSIESYNGGPLFTVKKEGILFNLFPTYQLQAVPVKLIASASIENTEITINDETKILDSTEPTELIDLYPGEYDIYASANDIFGTFEYEERLSLTPRETIELHIPFDGHTYSFHTNKEEAYLYVNGENTGKQLGELEYLGPVPEGAQENIEMHGEWEDSSGEIFKTDILTLNSGGWYGIEFFFNEEDASENEEEEAEENSTETDAEAAGDVVVDFRDAYENALNNRDFSLIESYMEDGSTVYEELNTYIGDLEDTDFHYDFQVNDVVDIEEISDTEVEVITNELFTFTNHLDETIDYDRTKIYTLILTDDTYKITDISYEETNRDYE